MAAPPITYLLDGKQYVAVAAGSSILTFALRNPCCFPGPPKRQDRKGFRPVSNCFDCWKSFVAAAVLGAAFIAVAIPLRQVSTEMKW